MSAARTRRPRDPLSRALTVLGVLVFVFLFLPILVIVVYSFNTGRLLGAWDSFGFDAYTRAWNNPVIGDTVRTSLVAGVLASMVSTVLGTIGGVALARARAGARWAGILTALLAVTLITPEVIDGIAILPWLVTLGTDGGLAVVNNGMVRLVIVHTSLAVAVVTFIVRARMRGMDEQIEEAAADLYAAPWNRFRQITLPLASPGIFAGALMAFTLSLDNTIVASFVQVPGYTPWPVYVFGSLKVGLRPEIAAVSTVMLLLTLAALAVVWAVLRRSGDDNASVASTFTGG
ncbi:ABC transporter permease [Mumia quercus]|uniref:ABC transporter permease n=1 Tax=Mumia quercus TaxID=2976125 RepID=UPI0021D14EF8|nr:ABC transporter permease [Mumia quercus]